MGGWGGAGMLIWGIARGEVDRETIRGDLEAADD